MADNVGAVDCIGLNDDGSLLATGGADGVVRLYAASEPNAGDDRGPSHRLQHRMEGHLKFVSCVTIRGDLVISGGSDATIRKWSASTGWLYVSL